MSAPLHRRTFLATLAASGLPLGAAQAQPAPQSAPQAAPGAQQAAPDLATRLAGYAEGLRYADLGPATIELVKAHMIDALGCAVAAFNEAPVKAVREIALAAPGGGFAGEAAGGATVIGTARRTTLEWAAFANGAAMRAFDLNDVYAGQETGHPSDNITPCLAVAEAEGRSGQDLILAVALAYEIDCRLLDSVRISDRGWDHPNFSLPAAALAAGKLMRLPPAQLAQAVNLAIAGHVALNQTRVQVISNWKGMADAEAGRDAVFAALLASGGVTGPAPIFEGDAGFFKQVSGPFTLDVDGFGGRSGTFKIGSCSIKFYPAQAHTQTAIPAAAKLGHEIGDFSQVKSIVVETTRPGYVYTASQREKWAPTTSETADHSLPYIVVRAMLDGDIGEASYAPAALRDPRALALLGKLTVREDPALTAMLPRKVPNRITVTLNDGRVLTGQVDDLPGFADHPMQREDVEAKFRRNVGALWPEAQVHDFLAAAWSLDQAATLSDLLRHMVVGDPAKAQATDTHD